MSQMWEFGSGPVDPPAHRRFVYVLIDQDEGVPYYIGQTKHPEIRLQQHREAWEHTVWRPRMRMVIVCVITERAGQWTMLGEHEVQLEARWMEAELLDAAYHRGWVVENNHNAGCSCSSAPRWLWDTRPKGELPPPPMGR